MTFKEIVEAMLKRSNKRKLWLSEMLDCNSSAISNMLKRNNVTIETLHNICELLDYEIVIQPKKGGRKPDGAMVLTMDGDSK